MLRPVVCVWEHVVMASRVTQQVARLYYSPLAHPSCCLYDLFYAFLNFLRFYCIRFIVFFCSFWIVLARKITVCYGIIFALFVPNMLDVELCSELVRQLSCSLLSQSVVLISKACQVCVWCDTCLFRLFRIILRSSARLAYSHLLSHAWLIMKLYVNSVQVTSFLNPNLPFPQLQLYSWSPNLKINRIFEMVQVRLNTRVAGNISATYDINIRECLERRTGSCSVLGAG